MTKKQLSDEEIFHCYTTIEDQKKSGLKLKTYLKMHGLNEHYFKNFKYKMNFGIDPEKKELVLKVKNLLESGCSSKKGYKQLGVSRSQFDCAVAYLKYISAIECIKQQEGESQSPMNFIAIKNTSPPQEPRIEVIEKKNDIELNIGDGVKVIVSSELDSTKILKIINFLKDL